MVVREIAKGQHADQATRKTNALRRRLRFFANIPHENAFLLDAKAVSGTVAEIQQH
jgi:hypothetical protein